MSIDLLSMDAIDRKRVMGVVKDKVAKADPPTPPTLEASRWTQVSLEVVYGRVARKYSKRGRKPRCSSCRGVVGWTVETIVVSGKSVFSNVCSNCMNGLMDGVDPSSNTGRTLGMKSPITSGDECR